MSSERSRLDWLTKSWVPFVVGLSARLLVFPWTENLWGDAPVRTEIARAWAANPGPWWSFREVFQFGPLPILLGGLAIKLGLGAETGPRLVALASGLISLWLTMRIARRFAGPEAAIVAGFALALNPLHIQASTTFLSEAIYAALVLVCIELTLSNRLFFAGLAAAAATVTRFDSWLWLPIWGAWIAWQHRTEFAAVTSALLVAALGPLSILYANHIDSGHALAPLTFIEHEHASLAMRDQAAMGSSLWRATTLAFWPGLLIVAMTPSFAMALIPRKLALDLRRVLVAIPALVPPLLYSAKTLLLGAFWPMPRLLVPSSTLLSALLPPMPRRRLRIGIAAAIGLNVALAALTLTPTKAGELACRVSPLVRLPPDLRVGVEAWKQWGDETTLLDEVSTWEDIAIAYHADKDRDASRRAASTKPIRHVIAIRGGTYDRKLSASELIDGVPFKRVGGSGRISLWNAMDPEGDAEYWDRVLHQ